MVRIGCNSRKYKFTLDGIYTYNTGIPLESPVSFYDESGRCWAFIDFSGTLSISPNYSWDGCTPKICIFNHFFGVPDGLVNSYNGKPRAYYASLVHDVLCQFRDQCPYSMAQIDKIFYDILDRDGFVLKKLYYSVVRLYHLIAGKG